jgi:hypothetical protein
MDHESTAKADRARAEAEDFCAPCQKTIWISFYFDAFGHHEKHDREFISNIGKLWRASRKDESAGIYSNYYPGLGTPYNPELNLLAIAAWEYERQLKKAKDTAKDKLSSPDAAKDFGKTVAQKSLENDLSGKSKGWWANIQNAYQDTVDEYKKSIKKWIDISFKPAARQRWMRGIQREWLNFVEDVAHHPGRALKTVYSTLGKATAGKVVEQVPWIRDNKWVATLFNTGVDTRFRAAEADFKTAVIKTIGKAKHINVAVFGADMGGALALSFTNQLQQTICSGGKYEGIKVNIKFIGLLDCVSARFDDNLATGFIPFISNGLGGDLKIPKAAQKVVHYAAAHEQRWYKPLSTIDGKREFGSRLEERLFPGAQEDVIGGYAENEEGASNQLSRLPLQMMLSRAWRFGVPVIPFEKLKAAQDQSIYPLFKMDDNVRDMVNAYWEKALALASTTTEIQVGMAESDIRSQYQKDQDFAMQAKLGIHSCVIPHIEKRTVLPADIKAELAGHVALFIGWLNHCCDDNNYQIRHAGYGREGGGFSKSKVRKVHFDVLAQEVDFMQKRAAINPLSPDALDAESKKYLDIWQSYNNGDDALGESVELFDKYVHDSLFNGVILKVTHDFLIVKNYLSVRRMTPLGQEAEKVIVDPKNNPLKVFSL